MEDKMTFNKKRPKKTTHNKGEDEGIERKKKLFLFVNMKKERLGAENDATKMDESFRNTLKFDQIQHCNDPTSSQMYECMKTLCSEKNDIDVFVLMISGHGFIDFKGTNVDFSDTSVPINEIIDFIASSLKALIGVTIIIMVNCCRIGDQEKLASEKRRKHRGKYPNLMLCFSSKPGEEAHRSEVTGSLYIKELCKVINDDHKKDMTIQKMLREVAEKVYGKSGKRKSRQTPEFVGFKEPYYLR